MSPQEKHKIILFNVKEIHAERNEFFLGQMVSENEFWPSICPLSRNVLIAGNMPAD